eukprot:TRINITY_DN32444_c0_g1_i1.p1 TRINITY_DN32444_c0_g1~~TRINITY_DN32444_c0_g1_i1.p1  ORF type:complete len:540 (+),score=107.21 TRINITY_DN32444_c0_g1_i1:70-1689(+)
MTAWRAARLLTTLAAAAWARDAEDPPTPAPPTPAPTLGPVPCTGVDGEFCGDVCCYNTGGTIAYCCPEGSSCCGGTGETRGKGRCCVAGAKCMMNCSSEDLWCVLGNTPERSTPAEVEQSWKYTNDATLQQTVVVAARPNLPAPVADAGAHPETCNLSEKKQCCNSHCCDVCCGGVCAPKGSQCCDSEPSKSCPPESPVCCPLSTAPSGDNARRVAATLNFLDDLFGFSHSPATTDDLSTTVCCAAGSTCCTEGSCATDGICCGSCNCCDSKTEFCSGTECARIPSDVSTPVLLMVWAVVFFSNIALLAWRWFEADNLSHENPRLCLYCGHPRHCGMPCTDKQENLSDSCIYCSAHCQRKDCHRHRACGKNFSRSQRIARHHATSETVSIKVVNLPCPCTECYCRLCVPQLECACKQCMCINCQSFTKNLTYYISVGSSILCLGLSLTAHYLSGYRTITMMYVVLTILWIACSIITLVLSSLAGGLLISFSGLFGWLAGLGGEGAAETERGRSGAVSPRDPDSRSPQHLQVHESPSRWN